MCLLKEWSLLNGGNTEAGGGSTQGDSYPILFTLHTLEIFHNKGFFLFLRNGLTCH